MIATNPCVRNLKRAIMIASCFLIAVGFVAISPNRTTPRKQILVLEQQSMQPSFPVFVCALQEMHTPTNTTFLQWSNFVPLNTSISNAENSTMEFSSSLRDKGIAMGDDGICIAVGDVNTAAMDRPKVFYSISSDNCETWSEIHVFDPPELQPSEMFGAYEPDIEYLRNGIFIVIWEALDHSEGSSPSTLLRSVVAMRTTDNGATWSYTQISAEENYFQNRKSIASDHHGKVVITWEREDGVGPYISSTYSTDDGETWSLNKPVPITANTAYGVLKASNSSTWILVFALLDLETDTKAHFVKGEFAGDTLDWSDEEMLPSIHFHFQPSLSVATDNNGVWIIGATAGGSGFDKIDIVRSSDNGDTWSYIKQIQLTSSETSNTGLSMTTDGHGSWICVCGADSYAHLAISYEDNGSTWLDETNRVENDEELTGIDIVTDQQGRWVMYSNIQHVLGPPAVALLDVYHGPPTVVPTAYPTRNPTAPGDTLAPTALPSLTPTLSPIPPTTMQPTLNPSAKPTSSPQILTDAPTSSPTSKFFAWSAPWMLNETSAIEKNAKIPEANPTPYPRIAQSPEGTCIAVWRSESDYKSSDGSLRFTAFYSVSQDNCITWSEYYMFDMLEYHPGQAYFVDISFLNPNFVIVLVSTSGGGMMHLRALTSQDNGQSWTKSLEDTKYIQEYPIIAGNSNQQAIILWSSGDSSASIEHAYTVTTDGGNSWTEIVKGPTGFDIIEHAELASTGTLLLVGVKTYDGRRSPIFAVGRIDENNDFSLDTPLLFMYNRMSIEHHWWGTADELFVGKPTTDDNGIWIWPVTTWFNSQILTRLALARSADDGESWEVHNVVDYDQTVYGYPHAITDKQGIWLLFVQRDPGSIYESTWIASTEQAAATDWNEDFEIVTGVHTRVPWFTTDQNEAWHAVLVGFDNNLHITHLAATKSPTASPTDSPTFSPTPLPTVSPTASPASPSRFTTEEIIGIVAGGSLTAVVVAAMVVVAAYCFVPRFRRKYAYWKFQRERRSMFDNDKQAIHAYFSFSHTPANVKFVQDLQNKLRDSDPKTKTWFVKKAIGAPVPKEYIEVAIRECQIMVILIDEDYEKELNQQLARSRCRFELHQAGALGKSEPLLVHLDQKVEQRWPNSALKKEIGHVYPAELFYLKLFRSGPQYKCDQENAKKLNKCIQDICSEQFKNVILNEYNFVKTYPEVNLHAFLAHTWDAFPGDQNGSTHKFVSNLQTELKISHIACWMDELFMNNNLKNDMSRGIEMSQTFVAFASKFYISKLRMKRSNASFEFFYVLNHVPAKPIIVVLLSIEGGVSAGDNDVSVSEEWDKFLLESLTEQERSNLSQRVTKISLTQHLNTKTSSENVNVQATPEDANLQVTPEDVNLQVTPEDVNLQVTPEEVNLLETTIFQHCRHMDIETHGTNGEAATPTEYKGLGTIVPSSL